MKNFLVDIFTWEGRWNRLKFWIYPLVLFVIPIFIILTSIAYISFEGHTIDEKKAKLASDKNNLEKIIHMSEVTGSSSNSDIEYFQNEIALMEKELEGSNQNSDSGLGTGSILFPVIVIILYIMMTYVSWVSYIKRLHDLDKSGWMSLLLFIPFANIYLLIICGFFKGTQGPNKFGPDSLGGISEIPKEKQETVKL